MYVVFFVNLLFAKCSSATGGTDVDTMDTLPMDLGCAAEQEPNQKHTYISASKRSSSCLQEQICKNDAATLLNLPPVKA